MTSNKNKIQEEISEVITHAICDMIDNTDISIEEIANHPNVLRVVEEQVSEASRLIGIPQCAFYGFALTGYLKGGSDRAYTVVSRVGDASNSNELARSVKETVSKIEKHHSSLN